MCSGHELEGGLEVWKVGAKKVCKDSQLAGWKCDKYILDEEVEPNTSLAH